MKFVAFYRTKLIVKFTAMPWNKQNIVISALLLAILGLHSMAVAAHISAYSSDNESRTFDGWFPHTDWNELPYPPKGGLKGLLIEAKTENYCDNFAKPPSSSGSYIALINHQLKLSQHTGCDFVAQVLGAQRAGYKAAVVVYDWNEASVSPEYIDWNKTLKTPHYIDIGYKDREVKWIQIEIPSVVVDKDTGNSLKLNYTYDKGGHVVLTGPYPVPFKPMPAEIGFGCLVLGSIMINVGLARFGLGLGIVRDLILPLIVLTGICETLVLIWLSGLTLTTDHLVLLKWWLIPDVLALIFILIQTIRTKQARTYLSLVFGFGLTVVGLQGTQPHLSGSMLLMSMCVFGFVALVMLSLFPFILVPISLYMRPDMNPRSKDLHKIIGLTV